MFLDIFKSYLLFLSNSISSLLNSFLQFSLSFSSTTVSKFSRKPLNLDSDSTSIPPGIIALIAILLSALVIIVIVLIICFFYRKKSKYVDVSPFGDLLLSNVTLISEIHSNKTFSVYQGMWDGSQVSCSRMKQGVDLDQLKSEAPLLRTLRHPNVLQFVGITNQSKIEPNENNVSTAVAVFSPSSVSTPSPCPLETFLVHGYSGGMYLSNLLMITQISLLDKIKILKGIAKGMDYISKRKIVHRDLGARNVLVEISIPKYYTPKISLVGFARQIVVGEYVVDNGPIAYKWSAPESIRHHQFYSASDVWSFGVCMWEVLTDCDSPWKDVSDKSQLYHRYLCGDRLRLPSDTAIELRTIVEKCFLFQRTERLTFNQLFRQLRSLLRVIDSFLSSPSPSPSPSPTRPNSQSSPSTFVNNNNIENENEDYYSSSSETNTNQSLISNSTPNVKGKKSELLSPLLTPQLRETFKSEKKYRNNNLSTITTTTTTTTFSSNPSVLSDFLEERLNNYEEPEYL